MKRRIPLETRRTSRKEAASHLLIYSSISIHCLISLKDLKVQSIRTGKMSPVVKCLPRLGIHIYCWERFGWPQKQRKNKEVRFYSMLKCLPCQHKALSRSPEPTLQTKEYYCLLITSAQQRSNNWIPRLLASEPSLPSELQASLNQKLTGQCS